jgi:methylated-DNA-[protein]-cysteine S-methyltransferase
MISSAKMSKYVSAYASPLGQIVIAAEEDSLVGLCFSDKAVLVPQEASAVISQTEKWLDAYFDGEDPIRNISCLAKGTLFQETVWQILMTIPYGSTMSYQEIADRTCSLLGKKRMSAQAVGQAVSKNPILILIPCHRVLGKGGLLKGYSGGMERQRSLLQLESHI